MRLVRGGGQRVDVAHQPPGQQLSPPRRQHRQQLRVARRVRAALSRRAPRAACNRDTCGLHFEDHLDTSVALITFVDPLTCSGMIVVYTK